MISDIAHSLQTLIRHIEREFPGHRTERLVVDINPDDPMKFNMSVQFDPPLDFPVSARMAENGKVTYNETD